jgi:hypothetical protein
MISIETLCGIFNEHFVPPFVPDGLVKVVISEDGTLSITIGNRDVEISKNGDVLGCGTMLPSNFVN